MLKRFRHVSEFSCCRISITRIFKDLYFIALKSISGVNAATWST